MAQVEILTEGERDNAWIFDVQVLADDGSLRGHRLTLSWADYNLWSADGADEPSKVAEAVLMFMLAQQAPLELPKSFDASVARRRFPDADQQIPRMIRR